MVSRFLAFVGSLSCSEQPLNSSSMVHKSKCARPRHLDVVSLVMIQLKQEYKKLVEDFNCDIQEFITVQDPPALPSNILHLTPLTSLHSGTSHNMDTTSDEPGEPWKEPWKVQPPSQRTLSRQLMRTWPVWQTNIATVSKTRMIEQLSSCVPEQTSERIGQVPVHLHVTLSWRRPCNP